LRIKIDKLLKFAEYDHFIKKNLLEIQFRGFSRIRPNSAKPAEFNPLTAVVVLKSHLFARVFIKKSVFAEDELIRFCGDEYACP